MEKQKARKAIWQCVLKWKPTTVPLKATRLLLYQPATLMEQVASPERLCFNIPGSVLGCQSYQNHAPLQQEPRSAKHSGTNWIQRKEGVRGLTVHLQDNSQFQSVLSHILELAGKGNKHHWIAKCFWDRHQQPSQSPRFTVPLAGFCWKGLLLKRTSERDP